MKLAKLDMELFLIRCGHAINANNGKCAMIEDVLCEATTLACLVLASLENAENVNSVKPTP